MRLNIILFILAMGLAKITYCSAWRCKEPVMINGLAYYVTLTYQKMDNSDNKIFASLVFYLVCSESGSYSEFNRMGTHNVFRKTYTGIINNNISQSATYATRMEIRDSPSDILLTKYTQCFPTFYRNEIQLTLFTGNNDENIEINFREIRGKLFTNNSAENFPVSYIDSTAFHERLQNLMKNGNSEEEVRDYLSKNNLNQNFTPRFCSDIDGKDFPGSSILRKLLANNSEFQLLMNRDLYWEILRFRQIGVEYGKDKIKSLLSSFDQGYNQYKGNEIVLERKMSAMVNLLREAIKFINYGDIFYKDFEITIGKYNFNEQSFPILERNFRDDYYNTKRVAGTTSIFESSEGIDIYLSNWIEFSTLYMNQADAEKLLGKNSTNRKAKVRMYFLIQPVPCYDMHASFRGLIAYGLRADFYRQCLNGKDVRKISNNQIPNIIDGTAKRCFTGALQYLDRILDNPLENIYAKQTDGELNFGAVSLSGWSQVHSENCETGYFYLNGKIEKKGQEELEMTLYMRTNYYYAIRVGHEVVFYNSHTGIRYPLVIRDLLQTRANDEPVVVQMKIKVTRTTIVEMMNAKINGLDIQVAGATKYSLNGDPLYNWDPTISARRNTLGSIWSTREGEVTETLNSFLKKGL